MMGRLNLRLAAAATCASIGSMRAVGPSHGCSKAGTETSDDNVDLRRGLRRWMRHWGTRFRRMVDVVHTPGMPRKAGQVS